jgi:large subunit ribosomal protein L10
MRQSEKTECVQIFSDKLRQSQSAVLTDFKGLTVVEISHLRSQLRNESIEMRVVKNRLLKRALENAGCDNLDTILTGNTAISFGVEDPVAPARILVKFAEGNDKLIIKGGLLEGRAMDVAAVESLSRMPGRKELLGMMAYGFMQPATKMAVGFNATLLKVAHAFNALADKLEGSGDTA